MMAKTNTEIKAELKKLAERITTEYEFLCYHHGELIQEEIITFNNYDAIDFEGISPTHVLNIKSLSRDKIIVHLFFDKEFTVVQNGPSSQGGTRYTVTKKSG